MASTKRFVKNTGVYFVGSFATKFLQFLLIPLYAKFIPTEELGQFSIISVSVSLALPLLFQSIWEGTFRFVIEKDNEGKIVFATCTKYFLSLVTVYSILFIVISNVLNIEYGLLILLYGLAQVLSSYWQFSSRALKENQLYASSAVINTLISISLNFILIVGFNKGVESLLVANTVGTIVMVIILEIRLKLLFDIKKYRFDRILLWNVIKYSIPLAINSVSWWLFSSCNNYLISAELGVSQNGIYSMALKFGTILTTITSIITLAWNEEAFRSFGDQDRDDYFNMVLRHLVKLLFGLIFILIPVTYIAYNFFVFGDYLNGINNIGFIYIGSVLHALSCHLGSAFLARKESSIIFRSTLLGGIISVVLSYILICQIGLIGASIGTLTGYASIYYIRVPMLKKRFCLYDCGLIIIFYIIIAIGISYICSLLIGKVLALSAVVLFCSLVSLYINKKTIYSLIKIK